METFNILLAICEENPPVTGGFSSQMASNMLHGKIKHKSAFKFELTKGTPEKETKEYVYINYMFTQFRNPRLWRRRTSLSYSQYHGCWWPGDPRSQGISSNDIDLAKQEYSRLSNRLVGETKIHFQAMCVD